jgi:carbamoyltransferase
MSLKDDYILGIWDGHDSGAALIQGDKILFAVNEERLSRRKLEVNFPILSIETCLQAAGVAKEQINSIAVPTYDLAKTMTRLFPALKENYYQVRRKKKYIPYLHLQKKGKLFFTGISSNHFTQKLSEILLIRKLKQIGFKNFQLFLVDHHAAHAACAAYCSPFSQSTVLTVDGVGDGLSATIQILKNGELKPVIKISAQNSLGIFYEMVTFFLNMRELEDEGKVMCLADMANSEPENLMNDFFKIEDLSIKAACSPLKMFSKLEELAFKLPWEKFAWMAQRTLETKLVEFFKNAIRETKILDVSWAGGVAANIKANQMIRLFSGLKNWYVFPHMGDGGIALGAALYIQGLKIPGLKVPLPDVYLGPDFKEEDILKIAKEQNLSYQNRENISEKGAEILANGGLLLWYQGRMEYGPRALGNRSILAPPDDLKAKDDLNRILKRRSWFQPFCPTLTYKNAPIFIEDWDGNSSPFMTMGYKIKQNKRKGMQAVMSMDYTCRPQLLQGENPRFEQLLEHYETLTSRSAVLNTSFNRHGEPLVCSPTQAFSVFIECGFPYLAIENYLFENKNSNFLIKGKIWTSGETSAV